MEISRFIKKLSLIFITSALTLITTALYADHAFNGPYTGKNTEKIAFPIGGIGAGNFFIEGNGSISGISVRHRLNFFSEPTFFAAICIKGKSPSENIAKALEGPVPEYKIFGNPGNALGSGDKTYGLPRFTRSVFEVKFPFCQVKLEDDILPLEVEITGFSPFIPNEPDLSGAPCGAIEYAITNVSDSDLEGVFSLSARNFMGGSSFEGFANGFNVIGPDGKFAISIQDPPQKIYVDACWFRGGWFDPLSVAWNNIQSGNLVDNPNQIENSPGASMCVPIKIAAHETQTFRVLTAWYVPTSNISSLGADRRAIQISESPSHGTAKEQQTVSGYVGKRLVNTYDPDGDAHVGKIVSPVYDVRKKYLYFKVGGGSSNRVGVAIQEPEGNDFITRETFQGKDLEQLVWKRFDLTQLASKKFRILIFDETTEPWGHINADCFTVSDLDERDFLDRIDNLNSSQQDVVVLADFEDEHYEEWNVVQTVQNNGKIEPDYTYKPWYATRYNSVEEVLSEFSAQYEVLKERSERFAQTLKNSSLPPEIQEAIEANLAILKTPTILRQYDGRLWAWEGCQDSDGSCPGTCTHVWNYGQSLAHLFPRLERTFRQNEFNESLTSEGRQAFRGNLPILPGGTAWDASDGQLGTIMRLHREWRISGSQDFLKEYWPKVKLSLDYCIRTWDPNETGLLEKSHHNTYDINYLGIEGHCSSFYLGALAAACKMGEACGEDVSRYRQLLQKGRKRYENELFNGEYFIQKVVTPGADADPNVQSDYYRDIANLINDQGPKYQYGTGCLSDGVLGFWIAKVCGIDDELVDPKLIYSHLLSVYKYNFKTDLSAHANTQRPSYAFGREGGLLLCSWPHNDKPYLPFPYSDEVWTGIEYQVASHLAFFGEYEKARDIVATCRKRYDGYKRNPFDEYECGHFYARATSSFGLFQGMTGIRYDAVQKTLYYHKSDHDYKVPLFTETGYGTAFFNAQTHEISVQTVEGKIDIVNYQSTN